MKQKHKNTLVVFILLALVIATYTTYRGSRLWLNHTEASLLTTTFLGLGYMLADLFGVWDKLEEIE